MTDTPELLPKRQKAKRVLFVAFPDVGLLDLTGAQTVFWAATKAMEARGLKGYERCTASMAGGLVRSAEGLELMTAPLADYRAASVDTLIVPGSPHMASVLDNSTNLVQWLRRVSGRTRRTTSVCSGAFLLAAAGLLDGKRATTHWLMFDMMNQRFPLVQIDRDAIFVQQGAVWTSAGVTAGIDLALALVEADCGHEVAMEVARELVVFLKRPGGQSQFSELLQAQTDDTATFDTLNLWIAAHLSHPNLTVETLAEQAHMSPRNFARVFARELGATPAHFIESARLDAARALLAASAEPLKTIAWRCGFGTADQLRTVFLRRLGVSAKQYRQHFSRPR